MVITRRRRRGIVAALAAALAVAVVGIGAAGGDDDLMAEGSAEVVESDLPTGSFERFDGELTSFAEFEGGPLVINFWASWCPACVNELPEFQRVHETRDDVTFLGIANTDIRPAALTLAGDVGLTYELADDPNGDLFREFGLIAMPSTLFVDADGRIVEVFAGQLNEEALVERIDRLLEAS